MSRRLRNIEIREERNTRETSRQEVQETVEFSDSSAEFREQELQDRERSLEKHSEKVRETYGDLYPDRTPLAREEEESQGRFRRVTAPDRGVGTVTEPALRTHDTMTNVNEDGWEVRPAEDYNYPETYTNPDEDLSPSDRAQKRIADSASEYQFGNPGESSPDGTNSLGINSVDVIAEISQLDPNTEEGMKRLREVYFQIRYNQLGNTGSYENASEGQRHRVTNDYKALVGGPGFEHRDDAMTPAQFQSYVISEYQGIDDIAASRAVSDSYLKYLETRDREGDFVDPTYDELGYVKRSRNGTNRSHEEFIASSTNGVPTEPESRDGYVLKQPDVDEENSRRRRDHRREGENVETHPPTQDDSYESVAVETQLYFSELPSRMEEIQEQLRRVDRLRQKYYGEGRGDELKLTQEEDRLRNQIDDVVAYSDYILELNERLRQEHGETTLDEQAFTDEALQIADRYGIEVTASLGNGFTKELVQDIKKEHELLLNEEEKRSI